MTNPPPSSPNPLSPPPHLTPSYPSSQSPPPFSPNPSHALRRPHSTSLALATHPDPPRSPRPRPSGLRLHAGLSRSRGDILPLPLGGAALPGLPGPGRGPARNKEGGRAAAVLFAARAYSPLC